jgi:hypothetical protein
MICVLKLLSIAAALAACVASAVLAQPTDMNFTRTAAIRECCVQAAPYLLHTWGNWQLYVYRECMAKHGQME